MTDKLRETKWGEPRKKKKKNIRLSIILVGYYGSFVMVYYNPDVNG